jgi:hypothetical protein
MRSLITALLLAGSLSMTDGQEDHVQVLPRPEMVGDWATIAKAYQSWKITKFDTWGEVADGGSIAFRFVTDTGVEFAVLVANRSWWSAKDAKDNRQPIYITIGGGKDRQFKAYRVESKSAEEKQLLRILSVTATSLSGKERAQPVYIKALIEKIKNREPCDDYWPMTKEEVDNAK